MSACRSCRAPIRWARTAAGRAMPVDVEPSPDGSVQLSLDDAERLRATVLGEGDAAAARADGASLYRSHFATCPNADRHRKGGGNG